MAPMDTPKEIFHPHDFGSPMMCEMSVRYMKQSDSKSFCVCHIDDDS